MFFIGTKRACLTIPSTRGGGFVPQSRGIAARQCRGEARGNHSDFAFGGAASLMQAGVGWWLLIFWICIGGLRWLATGIKQRRHLFPSYTNSPSGSHCHSLVSLHQLRHAGGLVGVF